MNRWETLRATIQSQMKDSLDKSNSGKDEENWHGHAAALLYALTLMRQLDEPGKRHTTGYILPMIEIED